VTGIRAIQDACVQRKRPGVFGTNGEIVGKLIVDADGYDFIDESVVMMVRFERKSVSLVFLRAMLCASFATFMYDIGRRKVVHSVHEHEIFSCVAIEIIFIECRSNMGL
jgi:hypothetical protein